jgi:hypothetical protein
MDLRKKMFGEARFVFEDPEKNTSEPGDAEQITSDPKYEVLESRVGDQTVVAAESVAGGLAVEAPAVTSAPVEAAPAIADLKEDVNKNINEVKNVLMLAGLGSNPFQCAVPSNLVFNNSNAVKAELLGKIKVELGDDFEVSKIKGLLGAGNVDNGDLRDAMLEAFVVMSLDEIQKQLMVSDKYFPDYRGMDKSEIKYSVTFAEGGGVEKVSLMTYGSPYEDYKQKRIDEEAAQALANQNAEVTKTAAEAKLAADKERDAKALEIENSPVGGVLKMLGFGKADPETGLTGFQKIASGQAPFMAFIAGMFGVGGFADDYQEIKSHLPEKFAEVLTQLEIKGKDYLDKDKKGVVDAKSAVQRTIEELLEKDSEVKDEGGVRLSESFTGVDGELTFDLRADGAQLVIPKGETCNVALAGEGFKELGPLEEDKVFDTGILEVKNLPVGTIISKGTIILKKTEN